MTLTTHKFTVDFGGWDEPEIIAARLFGKMVEIAKPVVQEYLNDLYRDALVMHEFMPDLVKEARERGAADFWWAVRTHGTILQRYRSDYGQAKGILGAVVGYRIIVRHRRSHYFEADFIPDTEPYVALPLERGGRD